jgi:hypothetical protein
LIAVTVWATTSCSSRVSRSRSEQIWADRSPLIGDRAQIPAVDLDHDDL